MQNRLFPIYNAIDDENYDLAIKICDKAMKKGGSSDCQTLKALKALAKGRSGQFQEAYDMAYEVKQSKPIDSPTLQAVFMTFKLVQMHDDIIELYDNAYKLSPGNEEWANHWFMALARKGDWKLVQQAAVKINKDFKKPKYYFWMTMAIYLQALEPNVQNKFLLLNLAERMICKAADEGKILDFESLQLYTQILCSCSKYESAYKVLTGPLGKLCKVETERKKMCVEMLLMMEGKDNEIAQICSELLLDNPDDWSAHKMHINSLLGTSRSEDLLGFLKMLQRKVTSEAQRATTRGAFLAELYCYELPKVSYALSELILNYINRFGATLCCFDDLLPVLKHVPDNQTSMLVERLESFLNPNLVNFENQVDQTRMNISILKSTRYYKSKLQKIDVSFEISSLMLFYKNSLILKVKDERERQYGDDYILLAAHAILEEYFVNRSASRLIDAIVLLEYGLEKSKFNYLFKVILIRLYIELGISVRALDLATSLEIKNIQFDTLSYIFTDGIEVLGNLNSAARFLNTALSIYDRNEIETPEMILQAFKFGTYSKIPEFINFKRRLRLSVQRAITNRQINRLELIQSSSWAGFVSTVKKIDVAALSLDGSCPFLNFTTLSDNRDTTIIHRYIPSETSFLSDLHGSAFPSNSSNSWLKLNSLIPFIYVQLLGECEFQGFSSKDLSVFLESSSLNQSESIAARILLLILQCKEGADINLAVDERLDELQGIWNMIEKSFEEKIFSLTLAKEITSCIEAWNALFTLLFLEKNKNWKSIVSKQIRAAKKSLSKFQTLILNEPVQSLRSRLVSTDIPIIQATESSIEFIHFGWATSISGFMNLLDAKISFLVSL